MVCNSLDMQTHFKDTYNFGIAPLIVHIISLYSRIKLKKVLKKVEKNSYGSLALRKTKKNSHVFSHGERLQNSHYLRGFRVFLFAADAGDGSIT